MKRFSAWTIIAFVALILSACSGSTPSSAAQELVGDLQSKNYQKLVNSLATDPKATPEETTKNKEMLVALLKEKGEKTIAEKGGLKSYEVISENVTPDESKATVKMKYTYGNGTTEEGVVNLVKADGKWKGTLKK